jgi:cytochrome c biogenesis protein ResB
MATKTKAQLQAELTEARAMIESLRTLNEAQEAKLEHARKVWHEQNDELTKLRAAGSQPEDRSAWRAECDRRLAAMKAAREEAMRTKKTVPA